MATVRPDSRTKWPTTSQRDVTHVGSAVSVTSLMTSSRQVRGGVMSFLNHYAPKRTFFGSQGSGDSVFVPF